MPFRRFGAQSLRHYAICALALDGMGEKDWTASYGITRMNAGLK